MPSFLCFDSQESNVLIAANSQGTIKVSCSVKQYIATQMPIFIAESCLFYYLNQEDLSSFSRICSAVEYFISQNSKLNRTANVFLVSKGT